MDTEEKSIPGRGANENKGPRAGVQLATKDQQGHSVAGGVRASENNR